MKRIKALLLILLTGIQCIIILSCTGSDKMSKYADVNQSGVHYPVYIINYNLHTGIVIPLIDESLHNISALRYFKNYQLTDIGWGEENFYQDPSDNFCMAARAVLFPNSSVLRIEGYGNIDNGYIGWSDFTVKLTLTKEQFIKLSGFIENSFRKDEQNGIIITSEKHSGGIIFFKSVYKYHLFNTCNTWVARALESSGLDVSPLFIITAGQLYNEIKDKGTVLKPL